MEQVYSSESTGTFQARGGEAVPSVAGNHAGAVINLGEIGRFLGLLASLTCTLAISRRPSYVALLGAVLLGLEGGSLSADAVTMDEAPQAWVVYAQRVSQQFEKALEGKSEAAQRFHANFEQGASGVTPDAPPVLRVKVWFDSKGQVRRVEFDSLGDDGADAALRQVLLTQVLGLSPRDMKQPVIVRLSLAAQL
ncbi:hypothetical protein [Caballeronia mineralivorans]|uniref:hypothetical protein n=1 Tax=Caballeronia mineralivorans TaxID=2010198 RepID=UPI00128C727E|nr:hypothetical protein [Caballeronia mineralivorans]